MPKSTCGAPDCTARPWGRKAMCRNHHERMKRNGTLEPQPRGPKPRNRTCSIPHCNEPHKAHGYCRKHLDRERAAGRLLDDSATCAFAGCGKPLASRGLCQGHKKQRDLGQPLRPLRVRQPRAGVCPAPGCDKPIHSAGHCPGHEQIRSGRPLAPIDRTPPVPKGNACWADDGGKPCGRRSLTKDGICRTHYKYRRDDPEDWQRPIQARAAHGDGHLDKHGYRLLSINGRTRREHHIEAEKVLTRPLLDTENVHHRNGNRADNRTDGPFVLNDAGRYVSGNLEIWSTAQPAGQEVGPKVAWARELLGMYGDSGERRRYRAQRDEVVRSRARLDDDAADDDL